MRMGPDFIEQWRHMAICRRIFHRGLAGPGKYFARWGLGVLGPGGGRVVLERK